MTRPESFWQIWWCKEKNMAKTPINLNCGIKRAQSIWPIDWIWKRETGDALEQAPKAASHVGDQSVSLSVSLSVSVSDRKVQPSTPALVNSAQLFC